MEYKDTLYSSRTNSTNYHKKLKLINQNNYPDNLTKCVYRPINPSHPFNSQIIINPKEISKKKNEHLILNDTIKNIIVKFNNDKRKKNNEIIKNQKYFYNQFKDEEKKYYLALKTILKKDFDNLPKFLSQNKENRKRKKNLKNYNTRNKNTFFDKLSVNNKSLGFLTTTSKMHSFKKEIGDFGKAHGIFLYTDKNVKSKNYIINNNKLQNLDLKLKLIKKATTTKELNYTNRKHKFKNINNLNIRKPLNFSVTNMISKKLGKLSIFGVFEDNGIHGKTISSIIINYLIEYFEKSKEMIVCLEKNNFYSILHWSFLNAQKYLINNAKKLNIDLSNSGCMGCILLIPKNNKNIFYCANSGKCKCIIYTNRGTDILCFTSCIERISERERIFQIIKNKEMQQLEKELKKKKNTKKDLNKIIEKEEDNKIISIEVNNNKIENQKILENNDNIIKEEIKINEIKKEIDEEKYVKYFQELGFTRCFGNLSNADMGLTPDPEITECDLRAYKVKFAVLGNTVFWKYVDEKEVRFIVSKYLDNNDTMAATKEIEELIKQKVGISSKVLLDSSFVIVYFDTII